MCVKIDCVLLTCTIIQKRYILKAPTRSKDNFHLVRFSSLIQYKYLR